MYKVKLQSVVTKALLGTTLGIAAGFIALAGTSSTSFAAAAKPAAKPATHVVAKTKTVSTKPKTATKVKTSAKHTTAKKHAVKHTAAKKHVVKHATAKHAVKTTAKKPVHASTKTAVTKVKVAPKKK